MDIAKKIKNANCEAQFYQSQLAKDLITQNKVDQSNPQISTRRISFEAETCAITPFDYLRLFFSVEADQIAQKLNIQSTILFPNLRFQLRPIPAIKFIVAPLSKILLNKIGGDPACSSNFQSANYSSGFLSLDHKGRVLPLMPNDPSTFTQKVCGIWVFGEDDARSPYVWSACARFVFCTNHKEGRGQKVPGVSPDGFIMILIDQRHRSQFFQMKMNQQETDWCVTTHQQTIEREPNLFFKPFKVDQLLRRCIVFGDYMDGRILEIRSNGIQQLSQRVQEGAINIQNQAASQIHKIHESIEEPEASESPRHQDFKHIQLPAPPSATNKAAVNRSRNSLSQNRLQQQQALQEQKNDNQEEDDMVRVRNSQHIGKGGFQVFIEDDGSSIHATPRSRKVFYEQQAKIMTLEKQVELLNQQVQHLNDMVMSQQKLINEGKIIQLSPNYSGQTTAYQTKASPNSGYNSGNNPLLHAPQPFMNNGNLVGNFNQPNISPQQRATDMNIKTNYFTNPGQKGPIEEAKLFNIDLPTSIHNLELPQLVSQPTGQFPQISNSSSQSLELEQKENEMRLYKQRMELGQLETQERYQFNPENDQIIGQVQNEEPEIPIPDTKSIGDKRSRNRGNTNVPQIHLQAKQFSSNDNIGTNNDGIMKMNNDIPSSQTVSEVSIGLQGIDGGDSSNSRLKQSENSALSTMNQELKAMKSDLKQQYEEQIISQRRPKGSRNVLNTNVVVPPGGNINIMAQQQQLKRKSSSSEAEKFNEEESKHRDSSEQSSSEDSCSDSRGDIDHTYNPYSLKKLEKAIFSKKIQNQPSQKAKPNYEIEQTKPKVVSEALNERQQDPIVVTLLKDEENQTRRGKTDWTMDLPQINYDDSEDEDDTSKGPRKKSQDSDSSSQEKNQQETLIRVEDIALSEGSEYHNKKSAPKQQKLILTEESEEEDESIRKLELKYLMMPHK
ncbi:hypothetical protein FGO68_gene3239 [Halteria grandinella]|uniref:STIL N-terminal domain-containing protein n=1 Tax=Halteria grandinella TaxID=5974 RepID=A0A8J8P1W4_HALGN|nr:hypothetical protein FGO68_gene3239 [Halteria grandinella]